MVELSKEELELYRELQHLFPKDWQVGDSVLVQKRIRDDNIGIIISIGISSSTTLYLEEKENPERGLWGMVDWTQFYANVYSNGKMSIKHRPVNEYDWKNFRVIDTPTLALLRALKAQVEK